MVDRIAGQQAAAGAGSQVQDDLVTGTLWREEERIEALHDLRILDTPPEPAFDRIIAVARRLFDVPIVLVSLVDRDRQWFKARCGLDVEQTERSASFCAHALDRPVGTLVILDALEDPRFRENRLVTGPPFIRFYAGALVAAPNGIPIGTLCIIDKVPRDGFSSEDEAALLDLAAMVSDELALRDTGERLQAQLNEAETVNARLAQMLDRQDQEMRLAAQAQRTILPSKSHKAPGLNIATMLRPSYIMSGDTYGYGRLREGCGYFWLADVSGHGLAAALLATTLSLVLTGELLYESAAGEGRPPAKVIERLHRQLALWRDERSYFTMVYGVRRAGMDGLRIAVAGHPPPIAVLPGEPPRALSGGGLPVGMFEDSTFTEQTVPMPAGARLLVYSDGVTDATNDDGEEFEIDRVMAWLEETRDLEPEAAVSDLQGRLTRWCGLAPSDDATALVIDLA